MAQQTDDDHAYAAVAAAHASPLWRYYGDLFPAEPKSRAQPFRWSYKELRPWLLHFTESLSLEDAERRVLMLTNPGLQDPPATLTTIYAGIQVILPGETAQAHRHASNAFRFVIEGSAAVTTVNGERLHMEPGDLLLTPGWHWHDHHHEFEAPMIWLDGLDYPLINLLEAGFFELYGQRRQEVLVPDDLSTRQYIHGQLRPSWEVPRSPASPVGNYPWKEASAAFDDIGDDVDGSAVDGILLTYTNPFDGGPVLPTMGCQIQRLPPGFHGQAHRHTTNTIYHVLRGEGTTIVDGVALDWHEHDVFAVPTWSVHEHVNGSRNDDVVMFSYDDGPAMRRLGFYREEVVERQG
jgi:gentisate 1,2-dioxygenase